MVRVLKVKILGKNKKEIIGLLSDKYNHYPGLYTLDLQISTHVKHYHPQPLASAHTTLIVIL